MFLVTSFSVIYPHFQETLMGAFSMHPEGLPPKDRFMRESERNVDYNQIAYYPSICANR